MELLRCGEIDAVLATLSTDVVAPRAASDLSFTPMFSEQLAVLAPPGHALSRKKRVDLSELRSQPWILPPGGTVTTVAIRDAFMSRGLPPPLPWIESSGVHASIELVTAGLGLCAAPTSLANSARRRGLVALLKVDQPVGLPPVCFMHRRADGDSRALALVRAALSHVVPGCDLGG